MSLSTLTLIEGSANANVLFTSVTKAQKDALVSLTPGEAVFQTDNSSSLQVFNGTSWEALYGNIPQNLQTSLYTLVSSDNGKHICTTGDSVTIPANVFKIGDHIQIFNNATNNMSIMCSSVTAYIAGVNTVKTSVTLSAKGKCEILFYEDNKVVISGNVN